MGMVHIDAHSDTSDTMLGEKIAHGTPFRRAVEDGCLDPHRVIQIGLRGSNYTVEDYDWARKQVKHGDGDQHGSGDQHGGRDQHGAGIITYTWHTRITLYGNNKCIARHTKFHAKK